MKRISLTDFVDIVSAAGTPKATKVRKIQTRPEYHPAFDYYKKIRERIIEIHSTGLPKSSLNDAHKLATDPKKKPHYTNIASCYKKWWGKKTLEWFTPDHGVYERHGVEVSVNPELGLVINGHPHVIKLYFKTEPLSKNKVEVITHIMTETLGLFPTGPTASVLDIQNKKLITPTVPVPNLNEALSAELAYISAFLS